MVTKLPSGVTVSGFEFPNHLPWRHGSRLARSLISASKVEPYWSGQYGAGRIGPPSFVKGVSSRNLHEEVPTGKPVGREVW